MVKATKSSRVNQDALTLSRLRRANKQTRQAQGSPPDTQGLHEQSGIASDPFEISEILTKRYGGVSIYGAVMLILAVAILWTAVLSAAQVQQYHQDYMQLQKMKSDYRQLQIEHQRLTIEQQTFSATPQIASRAVTQLGMYSPTVKDKLILQPMAQANPSAQTSDLSSQQANSLHASDVAGGLND